MNNDLYSKVLIGGLITAAIGYIFSIATTSIGLMVFAAATLGSYPILIKTFRESIAIRHMPLLLLFLFLIAGSTYANDVDMAKSVILRFLPFIVLPLLFLVTPPLNCRKIIFKSLIFALSVFFLICLLNAFYRQHLLYERIDHFNWYFFYRYDFLEIFKQHPTYVSMYTNLAISFLLFERLWTKNYWPIIFFIILASGLVLAGSRMGYALFILICSIGIVQHLRKACYGQRRLILILLSCLLPLTTFLLWKVPIVKERILYTLGADYEYKYNNGEFIKNKLEVEQGRLLLWKDTWELIKERPIIGYGTGSKDQVLTHKYQKEKHQLFLNRKYNTHNIYLEFLLTGGILKLAIYLLGLSLLFYTGFTSKDLILVSFFLIIFLTGITESIFRAQGIMFFTFFYCFLMHND